MDPVVYTPVSAAANLRRSSIISAGLGIGAIVVCSLAGHPLMGVFALVGLALGAANNFLLQKSVLRYAVDDMVTKKRFRRGVMGRLAAITLIAIGVAVLVRPDGLAVFVGLAIFHVIMLVGAAVPVLRSLRPTS